ncbi:hypothetical protein EHQ24_06700 [Leptospira noumeaensis]|uniref:Lipoprotein n=1 Tax=Leptospira noumeaensis TaxID=2484964 RepID=A0A4R9IA93_9LEPT|nr:hypothetical protein [Leptospira noumeaensis]TGK83287.1 hypothetical protein EHQ24_06700 [Leptospira noumeaensis]
MIKKITIIIVGLLTQFCLNQKSSLLNQNFKPPNSNQKELNIYIRNVELINEIGDYKNIQEETLKTNMKILLENTGIFKSVNYYSEYPISKNSILLDFKFIKYENTLKLDPLYIPLSIATFTLYIWLGGSIVNFESKIQLEVKSFDQNKQIIKSQLFEEENYIRDYIYEPWRSRRVIPEKKSKFILNSVIQATEQ